MPWCDDCEKYWAPTTLTPEGDCPTCGRDLDAPPAGEGSADEKAPWHFKLLVVALVAYLGWRFWELFFA